MAAKMCGFLSLLSLSVLTSASPIYTNPEDLIARKLDIDTNNLDTLGARCEQNILPPYPTSEKERRAALIPRVDSSLEPGSPAGYFYNDGSCAPAATLQPVCNIYCPMMSHIVTGAPMKVSDDIECSGTTCSISHAVGITISSSWSVSASLSSNAGMSEDKNLLSFGGSATFGFYYTWTQSESTTNSYRFNLAMGDQGYVQFIPYMVETYGVMMYFQGTGFDTEVECVDGTLPDVSAHVVGYDDMACGQAPYTIDDSSGNQIAAGVSRPHSFIMPIVQVNSLT